MKVNDFKKVVAQEEEVDPTSEGPSDGWCGMFVAMSPLNGSGKNCSPSVTIFQKHGSFRNLQKTR